MVGPTELTTLRTRGGGGILKQLLCIHCKKRFVTNEKLLEGINLECKGLKLPEFNP